MGTTPCAHRRWKKCGHQHDTMSPGMRRRQMNDINDILRMLDREIWLVTAEHESRRAGLIATFGSNASIVPESPRMLIGIAKQHHTWSVIEASRAFTLHLLDETQIE